MAVTFGFYNSVANDRLYNATHMAKIFDGIINDGVFMTIGTHLNVTPGDAQNVSVGAGKAWFDHTWTLNDAALVLSLANAHALFSRYDTVILEVDSSDGVRANSIKILTGTAASIPVMPTRGNGLLANTSTLHQYALAYISISPGSTFTVNSGMISNRVGTGVTPYVTGPLTTIDATSTINQWQAQFTEWFNLVKTQFDAELVEPWQTIFDDWLADIQAQYVADRANDSALFDNWFSDMQNQLSTDAAGNLQLQINDLEAEDLDIRTDLANLIKKKIHARQGGNPSDWTRSGSTNYDLTSQDVLIQIGNQYVTGGSGNIFVTFPTPYASKPLIFVTPDYGVGGPYSAQVVGSTASGFTALMTRHMTVAPYHEPSSNVMTINWIAIGPTVA